MPRKITNAPLVLIACKTLLDMSDTPLHYKMITEIIVEAGMIEPYGKEGAFDQIVYSTMHNQFKKDGINSGIVFMGNGMFCSAKLDAVEYLELPTPSNNNHHQRRKAEREAMAAESNEQKVARLEQSGAKCLMCRHISFTGPDELTMKRGSCGHEESGRNFVKASENACIHFTRVGQQTLLSREKRKHELNMKLMQFTAETTNFRGRDRQ